jgi:hypothetical protein
LSSFGPTADHRLEFPPRRLGTALSYLPPGLIGVSATVDGMAMRREAGRDRVADA